MTNQQPAVEPQAHEFIPSFLNGTLCATCKSTRGKSWHADSPDPQERGGATGSSHSGTRIIEVPEDELRTLANERLALLAQLAERKARSQELTTVKESLFRISTDLSAQVEAMRGALSAIKYLNLDHKPADEAIALMRSWASDGLVALDGQAQPQPDVASPTDS